MGRSLRPHGVGPALLAVTILVCACSLRGAGRNLGRGAVQGVQETRGDLGNAVGSVIDTAVFRAGRAFEDSLRPRLDSTAAALLSLLEERVGTLQGELAGYVSRDLSLALGELLAANSGVLRDSLDRALSVWLARVTGVARGEFGDVVAGAADSAASRAVHTLNAGLGGPLRLTALRLVTEIADSVRAAARRTAEEPFFKRIEGAIWLVGGVLIAALVAFIASLWIGHRKSQRSLEVVATAIRDLGSENLKEEIKERAKARKVEGWLHDFLVKRDLA